jgi:flagellar P-ring protein FlgI
MARSTILRVFSLALAVAAAAPLVAAVRIKDITEFEGARANQLVGFGLVVGLDNTGGRSLFTQQVAVDMIQRFNHTGRIVSQERLDPVYRAGTVSAVMVTTEIGPFARRGSRLDVLVSVVDDATSLQGGTLIMTPLRGADGVDYAVAQGPLSVGGFTFTAPLGTTQPAASNQKNHPTVGRVPGGAFVEREVRGEIICNGQLRLLLQEPDYNTAKAIAQGINGRFPNTAYPLDPGTVHVLVPREQLTNAVGFANEIGLLEVNPDTTARIVINERTGTIVAGENVKLGRVAVAHGNLTVTTNQDFLISQPQPFSRGTTGLVPQTDLRVQEQTGTVKVVEKSVSVNELARALNALGYTPRDLIAIFQTIKAAGALHADLIIR